MKVLSVFVGSVLFNSTQIQGPCTPHPSFTPCLLQTHTVTSQVHVWSYMHLTSLVAQTVKRLRTMWETRVQSLGREDLLEKEMATHSSTLAWKIPWTEEPGRLQSMGSQSQTRLSDFTLCALLICVGFPGGSDGKESACNAGDLGSIPGLGRSPGKGNGYPLQYSGLEISMVCIVHGVAKRPDRS